MKAKIPFFLLWLLPVLVSFFFELLFADFRPYRWWNLLENVAFAFGMLLTVLFFNAKKIKTFLVNFYYLVFVFCLFFESVFFYLFGANFSPSAIFIMIETNADEALEFLSFYLDIAIPIYFLALAVVTFFYLKMHKTLLFKIRTFKTKLISAVLLIGLLVLMKFSGLIDPNLPYLLGISVYDYINEQQKMAEINIDGPVGHFENVSHTSTFDKSLYVLVIGESTTRDHLGIYGYYRNTTPKLEEIEEELLIYQKVISPHAFTISALQEALTLHNFEKENESSIVQLMNQAGFKTFWLSNQRPIGPYESLVTKISKASDVLQFTNSATTSWITPHDEVLLPYFEEALTDPADKKFIVLHILGTHLRYKTRYPKEFNYFTARPKSNFDDELARSRINAYDNAIRYMDYLLRKIIEKTRQGNQSSYVLFFSDHGEEVYENRYFAGHVPDNPTRSMLEIPFFLWRSEKFKKLDSMTEKNLKKPYSLSNFIYSLADLSQIDFAGMKKERSIFSKKFQPKKRVIGKGVDFDEYFDGNRKLESDEK